MTLIQYLQKTPSALHLDHLYEITLQQSNLKNLLAQYTYPGNQNSQIQESGQVHPTPGPPTGTNLCFYQIFSIPKTEL